MRFISHRKDTEHPISSVLSSAEGWFHMAHSTHSRYIQELPTPNPVSLLKGRSCSATCRIPLGSHIWIIYDSRHNLLRSAMFQGSAKISCLPNRFKGLRQTFPVATDVIQVAHIPRQSKCMNHIEKNQIVASTIIHIYIYYMILYYIILYYIISYYIILSYIILYYSIV